MLMYPRFAVLGSGSKANSYIFEWQDFSFVIDNGFSARNLLSRIELGGFSPQKIRYIFLTHGHEDHIRGVETLSRQLKIPVVHHRSLPLENYFKHTPVSKRIEPLMEYREGPLKFLAFPTYHDAPGAVNYYFSLGNKRFTLITDTGKTDTDMLALASRSDVVFLESNYCPDMLKTGPYPWYLKQRIESDLGHLSNQQALEFLNKIPENGPGSIYLVHLSDTNNAVDRVEKTLAQGLTRKGKITICPKNYQIIGEYGHRP
ncbi:MAG: hypothetical protein A2Z96_05845 [Spirochaetes bacterium GWB1_48_6]|nr:MAG: hypothetical protein A2Z96_05845 [Spirochaetes bacterium GWB1_48_6]